eukprot:1770837-Prorocentrum_lima.AAC.1
MADQLLTKEEAMDYLNRSAVLRQELSFLRTLPDAQEPVRRREAELVKLSAMLCPSKSYHDSKGAFRCK